MEAKIARADAALTTAGGLIKQAATAPGKKQRKEHTQKIFSAIHQTLEVLGGAAEVNTTAKGVVALFTQLIRLEVNRRDNEDEIVAVCYSMTSMVYVLRFLHGRTSGDSELKQQLETKMSSMTDIMSEFGDFADLYYNKCKHFIVRFIRAGDFKKKLREFVETFTQIQGAVEFLLNAQMAGRQARIIIEVRTLQKSIDTLIDRVGNPATEREKKASEYAANHGGPASLVDKPEELEAIAKLLQEPVTSRTRHALHVDLDQLLQDNLSQFESKLKGATMELQYAIEQSTLTLLEHMDAGPHDLISEPEIKELWKGNGWKLSVKCRYFIDALCGYYTTRFSHAAKNKDREGLKDSWTLKVLSKVMNYPAIGEAIDEDASGFISIYEMNHFLQKKRHDMSTPNWFAFWAVGWQYLNYRYTEEIWLILGDLTGKCQNLKAAAAKDDDINTTLCISDYLDSIKLIQDIVGWNLHGTVNAVDDLDEETGQKMAEVADILAEKEEAIVTKNLKHSNYRFNDRAGLSVAIGQGGFRIEQIIMQLLYLILQNHAQVVADGMPGVELADIASEWSDMDRTLSVLIIEFHERMKSLIRSWRAQKLEVNLEIQCYAGGLYAGWHAEFKNPENTIVKMLHQNAEDEFPIDTTGGNKATADSSIGAKVERLAQHNEQVDERLDAIGAMLQQLLNNTRPQARSDRGLGGSSKGKLQLELNRSQMPAPRGKGKPPPPIAGGSGLQTLSDPQPAASTNPSPTTQLNSRGLLPAPSTLRGLSNSPHKIVDRSALHILSNATPPASRGLPSTLSGQRISPLTAAGQSHDNPRLVSPAGATPKRQFNGSAGVPPALHGSGDSPRMINGASTPQLASSRGFIPPPPPVPVAPRGTGDSPRAITGGSAPQLIGPSGVLPPPPLPPPAAPRRTGDSSRVIPGGSTLELSGSRGLPPRAPPPGPPVPRTISGGSVSQINGSTGFPAPPPLPPPPPPPASHDNGTLPQWGAPGFVPQFFSNNVNPSGGGNSGNLRHENTARSKEIFAAAHRPLPVAQKPSDLAPAASSKPNEFSGPQLTRSQPTQPRKLLDRGAPASSNGATKVPPDSRSAPQSLVNPKPAASSKDKSEQGTAHSPLGKVHSASPAGHKRDGFSGGSGTNYVVHPTSHNPDNSSANNEHPGSRGLDNSVSNNEPHAQSQYMGAAAEYYQQPIYAVQLSWTGDEEREGTDGRKNSAVEEGDGHSGTESDSEDRQSGWARWGWAICG
ncbi:hypothetical protein C8R43DRAFT_206377 [Mycena crocata]|nr:hypothetical protein C8R43DRAFT_206377 [Mycena crocata]